MLKRILNFVQYNNALPIALSALFLSVSGAMAASPDARDALYTAQTSVRSVDNTYLVSLNPETRDFSLKITAIKEDSEKYYIEYSFNTVDIKDYVWREIPMTKTMTVSKKELLGGDLGIFVGRELAQLIDSQRAYLTEAKKIALKDGVTQKVVTVEYSGLVGKFLSPTEETFAGYTPTKPDTDDLAAPPVPATSAAVLSTTTDPVAVEAPAGPVLSESDIRNIIEHAVNQALARNINETAAAAATGATTESSSSSSNISTETTSTTAETATSTETASSTPAETPVEPEPEPAPAPDTTAPTITLNGNNPAVVEVGSSYVDLGAVVTDNIDQNLGFTMTPDSVDTSTTSTHTLTFTATDSAGNSTSITRTVNVE